MENIKEHTSRFIQGWNAARKWHPISETPPFKRILLRSKTGYVETRSISQHSFRDGELIVGLGNHKAIEWREI